MARHVAALPLTAALLVGLLGLLAALPARAQTVGFIAVTNAVGYSQNLTAWVPARAARTCRPVGLLGTGTGAISGTHVAVGDGSSSGGGSYNWGTSGNSDRALGSLAHDFAQKNDRACRAIVKSLPLK